MSRFWYQNNLHRNFLAALKGSKLNISEVSRRGKIGRRNITRKMNPMHLDYEGRGTSFKTLTSLAEVFEIPLFLLFITEHDAALLVGKQVEPDEDLQNESFEAIATEIAKTVHDAAVIPRHIIPSCIVGTALASRSAAIMMAFYLREHDFLQFAVS